MAKTIAIVNQKGGVGKDDYLCQSRGRPEKPGAAGAGL